MLDLELEVAAHIQRWMKLELQCWRECLTQSYAKIQSKANRYWFFIYNLLHEYLQMTNSSSPATTCDLTDFKAVEKCFDPSDDGGSAAPPDEPIRRADKLRTKQVVNVLKQFIESANFAEFSTRMRILKSFEQYLHHLDCGTVLNRRKNTLISILHNLHLYFEQFAGEVDERVKQMRSGVEKKLKEFVKVESYSKYLSYFSQEANISAVHRKLHKFLKEYEQLLCERVAATVFMLKANQMADINNVVDGKQLRVSNKVIHYMVDVRHFLASNRLVDRYRVDVTLVPIMKELLTKADRLFTTARTICKHAILHSHFPSLIFNLDQSVGDHIETCDYLRKLEVDRTQEKPRQKVQAKQILQQKRKALSDLYKILSTLGINYRTGLMESGLTEELTDLRIAPFCLKTMCCTPDKPNKSDQNLIYLNENLNSYFVRSMYKLKLLQTVMLTPSAELGLQHLERLKGYAIDMYLLVQSQRKTVSNLMRSFNQLKTSMGAIGELRGCLDGDTEYWRNASFQEIAEKCTVMRANLVRICDVFQQYDLLLRCVPSESDAELVVFRKGDSEPFNQSCTRYVAIRSRCTNILQATRKCLHEMEKGQHVQFHNGDVVASFESGYGIILLDIELLIDEFTYANGERIVIGKAVVDLLAQLKRQQPNTKPSANASDDAEFDNIDAELENAIHSMLFSMQSIYKKYSMDTDQVADDKIQTGDADVNDDEENSGGDLLQDNHLKVKINAELLADLETLNLPKILEKLSNILLSIRFSNGNYEAKLLATRKLCGLLPILEQYNLLCKFYLIQHIGAHKVSAKMLSIMLTVFVELGAKGFCVPPDLLEDGDGEDGGEQKEDKGSEGFGLEDGTGEKDVSDKLESEDQLDSAKKPGDDKETDDKEDANCKEEKGIDMSEDFDSKLQDLEKKEANSDDDSDEDDDQEEADKQMGETEDGAEKLDDQIWGSDEEKDEEEDEEQDMNEEDEGKGSKDEEDVHNDLANKNEDKTQGEDQTEGLDAADNSTEEKKKKEKDIDKMDEPEVGDDQVNPYHNELEEPPEPEDLDLADNFNLDKEDATDRDEQTEENPFDIDTMKENMEVDENAEDEDGEEKAEDENKLDVDSSDSDDEGEDTGETKRDEEDNGDVENEEKQPEEEQATESACPAPKDEDDEPDAANEENGEEKKENIDEDHHQSKDKATKEEQAQSMPDDENKGSVDQVQNQQPEKESKQQDDMDAQDTGEDKQAIGQAENEESKSGHQGVADTRETKTNEHNRPDKKDVKEKRKQGNTNEERTLGDPDEQEKKQLKTIEKLNERDAKKDKTEDEDAQNDPEENDEYQHVKEAKKTDKTTLDNATEEQSKQLQHEEEKKPDENTEAEEEGTDELMETDEPVAVDLDNNVDQMESEKLDKKSDKPSKKDRKQPDEVLEEQEPIEVEGERVDTYNVSRAAETSAHCA